jgi:hypothetical protein
VFVGSDRSVEAEKDRSEVGFRPFARVRLELGLDVDDESRANCREQTGLRIWSALHGNSENVTRTVQR